MRVSPLQLTAMPKFGVGVWCVFVVAALAAVPALAGKPHRNQGVRVALRPLSEKSEAFARVVPERIFRLAASLSGRITALKIRPGDPVRKGETLVRLTGADLTARLDAARQAVVADQAARQAARQVLASVRQKQGDRLATRAALARASLELKRSDSQLKSDQSRLHALQARTQLLAPGDGQVIKVTAANGDYVKAGQVVLEVMPARGLWLEARLYGRQGMAVQVGQKGRFQPDDQGPAIPVTVATTVPEPESPGRWLLYLTPQASAPAWFAGEAGHLILAETTRKLPAVPSRAMILDQGSWWLMVEGAKGPHPVRVTPAASRNGWTWLQAGVRADQRVLVKGAYQAFHRNFSSQYANPD